MVSCNREKEAADARAIMQALRALHTNPHLLDEARSDLPAALDRLGLSGIARHAIAATLALSVSGVALMPGTPIFWSV
jgi:hypothetical protein